jgi:hypothetical protein
MRFFAFDPGDVWLGFAALQTDDTDGTLRDPQTQIHAMTKVIHVPSRDIPGAAMDALVYNLGREDTVVICEDFKIRPQGHNAFSSGNTLRLIGALQYAASQYARTTWSLIPPGNAEKELPQLLGTGFFTDWQRSWVKPKNANWRHARSAWRVLARHLMMRQPHLLNRLRDERTHATFGLMPRWMEFRQTIENDLRAPAARWRLVPKTRRSAA